MKKYLVFVYFICLLSHAQAQSIQVEVFGSSVCAGTTYPLAYYLTGAFNSGNAFTAQLSDASGSFSTPVNIGTVVSDTSGILQATIPVTVSAGSAYRIRMVSTSPAIIGTDNGINLSIYAQPPAPTLSQRGSPCPGSDTLIVRGISSAAEIVWQRAGVSVDTSEAGFSANGVTIAEGNANQFLSPASICLDDSGNVYVNDQSNQIIQKFSPGSNPANNCITVAGDYDTGWAANQLYEPDGISVDGNGNLYVSNYVTMRVQRFPRGSDSATNGVVVAGGNGSGSTANQLSNPEDVYVDGSGYLYVADLTNNRIQKFPPGSNSTTNAMTVAGGNGNGTAGNQLPAPGYLWVDRFGNLYANENTDIVKYPIGSNSQTNKVIIAGNGQGTGATQFNGPASICVDGIGNLYVADFSNLRIQRFPPGSSSNTPAVTVAGGNGLGNAPNQIDPLGGVRIDNNGNLYVGDIHSNRIQKFTPQLPDSTYIPPTAGTYTARYITWAGCASPVSDTTTVYPAVVPAISQLVTQTVICQGANDTFSAMIVNGGATPYYQWFDNGSIVGTNSPRYVTASLTGHDSIWVAVISSAQCANPDTVRSNKIKVTVNPNVVPSITISGADTICAGSSATLNAVISNGGNSPIYHWLVDGIASGTNADFYTSSAIHNDDTISCILISNATCANPSSDTSNLIGMKVLSPIIPMATIHATDTLICAGQQITLTASVSGEGPAPIYDWQVNGSTTGPNDTIFTTNNLTSNSIVTLNVTSSLDCIISQHFAADSVKIIVNPLPNPLIIKSGNDTLETWEYHSYQWFWDHNAINGDTSRDIILSKNGSYMVFVVDSNGCSDTSAVYDVTNVGIISISGDEKFLLYPNPNTGSFVLQSSGAIGEQVLIYDMLGHIAARTTISSDRMNLQLDLSEGLYLLKVKDSSGQINTLTFTIAK